MGMKGRSEMRVLLGLMALTALSACGMPFVPFM